MVKKEKDFKTKKKKTEQGNKMEWINQCSLVDEAKTSFNCCVTRIKVVLRLSSLSLPAPT
jgi:hypothetical protein